MTSASHRSKNTTLRRPLETASAIFHRRRNDLTSATKISRHFSCSPDRLDVEDVRAFQVHLVANGISWSSLNQIVCALRFFYGVTLGRDTVPGRIVHAREPQKLPVVLSAYEVVRFLEAVASLKSRAALTCAYAAGLGVSEVVRIRICASSRCCSATTSCRRQRATCTPNRRLADLTEASRFTFGCVSDS